MTAQPNPDPRGLRVWQKDSGTGPGARFGVVMTWPSFPWAKRQTFSVCFDDEVWEVMDTSEVDVVTPGLENKIRGLGGPGPACQAS